MKKADPLYLATDFFSLEIKYQKKNTLVKMRAHETTNTRDLPKTFEILEQRLPTILKAKCFNDDHIPFHKELKMTEIGHLFEHIIIEYMCRLKLAHGNKSATFSGVTKWNWNHDEYGTFHISISGGRKNGSLFEEALGKSLILMQEILESRYVLYPLSDKELLPK